MPTYRSTAGDERHGIGCGWETVTLTRHPLVDRPGSGTDIGIGKVLREAVEAYCVRNSYRSERGGVAVINCSRRTGVT